jgi:hypothetical protein
MKVHGSQFTVHRALAVLAFACLDPALGRVAMAQSQAVEPIRCWWQSNAGAVIIGQDFSVVLTCAVIQVEAVQVVVDESRLGVASIQMAPFEILGGSHPPDTHQRGRRFFQYHYQLRIISADAIGKDVTIPALAVPYRVHSRTGAASLEGRDLTYLMPALPIKVLSVVPAAAADIRDGSSASLGAVDALRFRRSIFNLAAVALAALGTAMVAFALVPLVRGRRKTSAADPDGLPDRAIAARAAHELADLRAAAATDGWSDALVARGLAALRIVAGLATGRQVSEKPRAAGSPAPEGRLVVTHGRLRPRSAAVSSPTTADDVARAAMRLDDGAPITTRQQLEGLQSGLAELTSALYGQRLERDPAMLAEATRHGLSVAHDLARERSWWRTWWLRR